MNDLQIEYFLAVAENLSFTKTATEKYVSQPAISKQIAAMEEELGVTLFERSYKSIKLTESGRLFADFYKKHRQDLSMITKQAKDTHKQKKIPLRIGCGSGWILSDFMPSIIDKLSREHPEIKVLLESYNFNQLSAALGEGEADLVVALNTSLYATSFLEVHPLTEVQRVIVYSKIHPLAGKADLEPADFRTETFFIPAPDEAVHIVELVKSFCEPYGFTPRIQGVKSTESLILSVLNGLGVAVADLWTVEAAREGLCYIPLNSNHVISIAWRKNNYNRALPVFLHELAAVFYPDGNCGFDILSR